MYTLCNFSRNSVKQITGKRWKETQGVSSDTARGQSLLLRLQMRASDPKGPVFSSSCERLSPAVPRCYGGPIPQPKPGSPSPSWQKVVRGQWTFRDCFFFFFYLFSFQEVEKLLKVFCRYLWQVLPTLRVPQNQEGKALYWNANGGTDCIIRLQPLWVYL